MEKNKIKANSIYEFNKLRHVLRYLFILVAAFFIFVIIVQWFTIMGIRSTAEDKIYVSLDGELYAAIPDERERVNKDMCLKLSELFVYNMFSHDQYNFDQRTKLSESLLAKKDYEFIMAGFINDEQNIYKLYEKYDARTYFELDSMSFNQDDKSVVVFGQQIAVFGYGEESVSPLNCKFKIGKIDRSEKNPYGLQISEFNFIK